MVLDCSIELLLKTVKVVAQFESRYESVLRKSGWCDFLHTFRRLLAARAMAIDMMNQGDIDSALALTELLVGRKKNFENAVRLEPEIVRDLQAWPCTVSQLLLRIEEAVKRTIVAEVRLGARTPSPKDLLIFKQDVFLPARTYLGKLRAS